MNLILFDFPYTHQALMPLSLTRPISDFRVGILTLREKWEKRMQSAVSYHTADYLQVKYPIVVTQDNLCINSAILPDQNLVDAVKDLPLNHYLEKEGLIIALRTKSIPNDLSNLPLFLIQKSYTEPVHHLSKLTDIFSLNGGQIKADFELITKGRVSAPITDPYTAVYGKENIFVEAGVKIKAAVLNAENGVIYLGKNAQVSEGSMIQGNFALGESSVVNLGGKMRQNTSIGPFCKVGGEISNSVFFGYSNKAHDGFLGNSIVGAWCNLGAGTNTSNLKNNYSTVRIWDYNTKGYQDSGETFVGLMMGDHSKAGINTMFNTGTVVGVSSNVFGEGFPPKFIPSFSWGGSKSLQPFQFEKALEVAARVMERRHQTLTQTEINILEKIFKQA